VPYSHPLPVLSPYPDITHYDYDINMTNNKKSFFELLKEHQEKKEGVSLEMY